MKYIVLIKRLLSGKSKINIGAVFTGGPFIENNVSVDPASLTNALIGNLFAMAIIAILFFLYWKPILACIAFTVTVRLAFAFVHWVFSGEHKSFSVFAQ